MQRVAGRTFVKVFLVVGAVLAFGLITLVLVRLPEIRERTEARAQQRAATPAVTAPDAGTAPGADAGPDH